MPTGTFVSLHLAGSRAGVLLRVLEERLDPPAHPVGANNVLGRGIDLVRGEILDRILFVFVAGFFLGENRLHVSQLGDWKLLRPDMVGVVIDVALDRVDALCQRIDADLFTSAGHLSVASERADPVLAVEFDLFGEARIVGEPRVEEVGVCRDTYLVFEFGDDVAGEIVLDVVVLVVFVLLFAEAESERIDGFVVSVEGVDEVLAPDSIAFSVIVEVADAGDFVPGFLGDRVVEDDVAIPRPARFTVFLESFKSFMVELLFVPVVLREELVESAFVSSWKDFA